LNNQGAREQKAPLAPYLLDLRRALAKEERTMLWTIIAILVILWLLGLIGHIGGGLIHLLLIIAVIAFIFKLISGRRVAV
jgi:fatty acid desaturase